MKQRDFDRSLKTASMLMVITLLLAACGGGGSTSDSGESSGETASTNRPAVATMPSASFSSVGDQSAISETVASGEEDAGAEEGPDLALGERVYGNHCAECHGANADGGSASALTGQSLDEAAFEDLLRTGGDLGPDHLFGVQKVSDKGLAGLIAYLASLE